MDDIEREELINDFAKELLENPDPGAITNFKRVKMLELSTPNILSAWSHVVPALAKYATQKGKRNLFGKDKGEIARKKIFEKLNLVVLGLYGDGIVTAGARAEDCLMGLLYTLVAFKRTFPNWTDAYNAGCEIFVEDKDKMLIIIDKLQQSVEAKLYKR